MNHWRETHSRELTDDYFGATESRAYLRALYERLVSASLDALKMHNFDISEYRDKDGRLQIHAEKIDNLMIGEKMVVHTSDSIPSAPAPGHRATARRPGPAQDAADRPGRDGLTRA